MKKKYNLNEPLNPDLNSTDTVLTDFINSNFSFILSFFFILPFFLKIFDINFVLSMHQLKSAISLITSNELNFIFNYSRLDYFFDNFNNILNSEAFFIFLKSLISYDIIYDFIIIDVNQNIREEVISFLNLIISSNFDDFKNSNISEKALLQIINSIKNLLIYTNLPEPPVRI